MKKRISRMDWARLAAYIDGEGCMAISRANLKSDNVCPTFTLQLCIVNTNPTLLLWCHDKFEGGIYPKNVHSERHTQSYTWAVTGQRAENIIRKCLPYFLVKREQAELVLLFRKTYEIDRSTFDYPRENGRNFLGGVSRFGGQEVATKREGFRVELKRLKKTCNPKDLERVQEIIQ